ncbi:ribosomal RNA small subunit methyltransferase F [Candidatus Phycosocius bacilliformis]|uniref:Ribosomal RNA small subunit methyltransferase F n=1 Tax=Candidatus Phycosocius bacilliformis TaxID=1445552 RepID=A0A2P2E899_9PROT|nr:RsmB/NOP family class I SAM-dependent RNA methyltransferase [Candidatus Phycosocius bacilliformis]GBF57290.1 ribosomal RNA small subunit methyltransferase F [Candidatus Phycosocius bacilliformis]
MRSGARAQAAINILSEVEARKRPPADVLKDWGLSHRFAGSGDRAHIGDLVFGALRWKASSAHRMGMDDPRAWVLGALRWGFGVDATSLEQHAYEETHAYAPLTEAERTALAGDNLASATEAVRGDYPAWLDASMARIFGAARAEEGAAMAAPAPIDLRVNRLKAQRPSVLDALLASTQLKPRPDGSPAAFLTPWSPDGIRIPWSQGRSFPWAKEESFVKGGFEVQDEGSQLTALLAGVRPGMQVADVCAGGGGKTLALAALMENKGQLYAYDVDSRRLANSHERIERAGVRNCQVRTPRRDQDVLSDLIGQMDLVFVDAPCSGSGTWRRAPDSKWRLRPAVLDKRQVEQAQALALGAPLVRPGGRLVYVTCSVLPEENEDSVARFLAQEPGFEALNPRQLAGEAGLSAMLPHCHKAGPGLQMTPLATGTDGFFFCVLERRA